MIRGLAEMTDTVGCTDVSVFRRPVRRHPELIDDRPYDTVSREKHYEKAGGAPDKPSVEQREQRAAEIFSITRGGSRWRKLVTGDATHNLVRSSDIPVPAPPDREESEA